MGYMGISLQVGVLLGVFHHVEQRLHTDWRSTPVFMSNILFEKKLLLKPMDVQLKFAVNNLLNEDYFSVLSCPMPGINFELFIGITSKSWKN